MSEGALLPGRLWRRYLGALAPPLLLLTLFATMLIYALETRQRSEDYDLAALEEWVKEARVYRETLPGLIRRYWAQPEDRRLEAIRAHVAALGQVTKIYQAQLPLFPVVFRIELVFIPNSTKQVIVWDARYPRWPLGQPDSRTVRRQEIELCRDESHRAVLAVDYQMHAFDTRQTEEEKEKQRLRWLTALVIAVAPLVGLWGYFFLRRQRQRELQQFLTQQQIDRAQRTALENELQRKEAERQREEAERKTLELKSQLYAGIGIMAGSYAHNIKNLLVRPNDLLGRCLESEQTAEQRHHLQEVRQTLHTVTERLQQILRTLRRDPTRSEPEKLDLNAVVRDISASWQEIAQEKWRMTLTTELPLQPVWIQGDRSHLTQAAENLLLNARDAIYEMRNHLREEARTDVNLHGDAKRQAIISAAGWKGAVVLRTWQEGASAILEVSDNGIGMTDEVRRRCVETYFSTKRDNALHQGNAAGMGLGLSFVQTVLEHHQGKMEICSEPLQGTTIRLVFHAENYRPKMTSS